LFFKDDNGTLVKVGPVHVGTTAPNVSPAAGGTAGNSVGEQWLDTSSSRYVFKIWDGTAWRTEDGEFVNSSGDTMTGALVMDNQQQVRFRETSASGTNFIALQAPTSVASDKTITLPDVTGTVVTTGDTGTVTSTMLADGTIVNADINASAAIAGTKISPDFGSQDITIGDKIIHDGDTNTAIRFPAADTIAFETDGSERARIDGSGRLLMGASTYRPTGDAFSPTGMFYSEGSTTNHYKVLVGVTNRSTDPQGPEIALGRSRGSTNGAVTIVQNNDTLGEITFAGADGFDLQAKAALIRCEVDGTPGNNDMPGRLVFSTTPDGSSSPTERMRITNEGRQINSCTSAGNSGLDLTCTAGSFVSSVLVTATSRAAGTACFYLFGIANGVNTLIAYNNGNIVNINNSYGALSDIKLKENIVDASSQWSDIKALQVRKYNFKEETGHQTHTQIGLIAQEVELVSPGLVSESPDRDEEGSELETTTKSVNYSVLYMKAVKALQEAMERIEALEARVAALEA